MKTFSLTKNIIRNMFELVYHRYLISTFVEAETSYVIVPGNINTPLPFHGRFFGLEPLSHISQN